MQTARVTVLMTPERKAAMETLAAGLGVSAGEYIRLAVDNYQTREDEEQLLGLVAQLDAALPAMSDALDRSVVSLDTAHDKVDQVLRAIGARS